jgi:hypothetical protein
MTRSQPRTKNVDFFGIKYKNITCSICNKKFSTMSIDKDSFKTCAPCQNEIDGIDKEEEAKENFRF